MSYRNGTYVTFHANNTSDPTESDRKYYSLLQAWDAHNKIDFQFVNSHDKTNAVRDSSKRKTLEDTLRKRMNSSKNMILIIGNTTKYDDDWVPFEIRHALDVCKLPIFVVYPDYDYILEPKLLSYLWPAPLSSRIYNADVSTIHMPYMKQAILFAIDNYSIHKMPPVGLNYYLESKYKEWGEEVVPSVKNWIKLF